MKNATEFGNKVKKAMEKMARDLTAAIHPEGLEPLDAFTLAVLRQDAPLEKAAAGLEVLKKEFIDYNELRVAPPRDIVELLDEAIPARREKAIEIAAGLNKIYDHGNELNFNHVEEFGKRELRTHLREALGFSSFVEAYMMLHVFDARSIPVDNTLLEKLKAEKLVHDESDIEDVRSMLERIISAKDAASDFGLLSVYEHQPLPKKTTAAKKAKKTVKKTAKKAAKKTAKKAVAKSDDADEDKTAKKTAKAKTAKKAVSKTSKKSAKKTSKKKKTAKKAAK